MASNMSWGGLPFMTPSTLAMRYLYYEQDIIPECRIEVGQRYRARRNLLEHTRGYRNLKKSLQQRLVNIEHERKWAHIEPSIRMSSSDLYNSEQSDFARPNAPIFAQGGNYKMRYPQRPIFKQGIYPYTMPRAEEFLGLIDIRKKMIKNPSEYLNQEY